MRAVHLFFVRRADEGKERAAKGGSGKIFRKNFKRALRFLSKNAIINRSVFKHIENVKKLGRGFYL